MSLVSTHAVPLLLYSGKYVNINSVLVPMAPGGGGPTGVGVTPLADDSPTVSFCKLTISNAFAYLEGILCVRGLPYTPRNISAMRIYAGWCHNERMSIATQVLFHGNRLNQDFSEFENLTNNCWNIEVVPDEPGAINILYNKNVSIETEISGLLYYTVMPIT